MSGSRADDGQLTQTAPESTPCTRSSEHTPPERTMTDEPGGGLRLLQGRPGRPASRPQPAASRPTPRSWTIRLAEAGARKRRRRRAAVLGQLRPVERGRREGHQADVEHRHDPRVDVERHPCDYTRKPTTRRITRQTGRGRRQGEGSPPPRVRSWRQSCNRSRTRRHTLGHRRELPLKA